MSDEKPAVGGDDHKDIGSALNDTPSIVQEKTTEGFADINHVARLGMANAAELEKKIVRKLDIFMLPQLWILYMFNYLNRTNIAQARLNSFNEDLNLGEGDYQVCCYGSGYGMKLICIDCCCGFDCWIYACSAAFQHVDHSCPTFDLFTCRCIHLVRHISIDRSLHQRWWSLGRPVRPRYCRGTSFPWCTSLCPPTPFRLNT
jgi:hypothetical protein